MQLNDLLGFQLAEAEQRLRQDGLSFRVEVSKAPRAADNLHDSSQLRVARARREGELVILTVVRPPALELPE